VEPLIDALDDKRIRNEAAMALGKIGDKKAIKHLIKAISNQDPTFRSAAEEALGLIGDEEAVPPLIKALENDDISVRRHAAGALAKIGDDKALGPLKIAALKDRRWYVRLQMEEAITEILSKKIE
jgi:HEAT repeat protein